MLEFEIQRAPFLNAIKTIGLIATKNRTGHFLEMKCRQNQLKLFGQADGEMAIQMFLDPKIDGIEYNPIDGTKESGSVVVYENLLEPLSKMDDYVVHISLDGQLLTIKGTGERQLKYKLNNPEKNINGMWDFEMAYDKLSLETSEVNKWIDSTVFATFQAENITRPFLMGINATAKYPGHENKLVLTATDSYRLSQIATDVDISADVDVEFTANAKHLVVAQKVLKAVGSEKVEFSLNGTLSFNNKKEYLVMKANNCLLEIRNLSCGYPDTKKFFTANFDKSLEVKKSLLKATLERSQIMSDSNEIASAAFSNFNLSNDGLEIERKNAVGDFKETVPDAVYSGEPMTIIFYNKYILEAISAIDSEDLEFKLIDERKPVLITGKSESKGIISEIVLPVKKI